MIFRYGSDAMIFAWFTNVRQAGKAKRAGSHSNATSAGTGQTASIRQSAVNLIGGYRPRAVQSSMRNSDVALSLASA
jgi:hypothetical protein